MVSCPLQARASKMRSRISLLDLETDLVSAQTAIYTLLLDTPLPCLLDQGISLWGMLACTCETILSLNFLQGVQRPGKPGIVREFRCKEKNSEKSQGILWRSGLDVVFTMILCRINFFIW